MKKIISLIVIMGVLFSFVGCSTYLRTSNGAYSDVSLTRGEDGYTIKLVLPALCPDVSYNELEINNGMDASNQFLELYYCKDENHIADTRQHLLKYCHLDTLAMVRILEVLRNI
jgi:hypothetical protein